MWITCSDAKHSLARSRFSLGGKSNYQEKVIPCYIVSTSGESCESCQVDGCRCKMQSWQRSSWCRRRECMHHQVFMAIYPIASLRFWTDGFPHFFWWSWGFWIEHPSTWEKGCRPANLLGLSCSTEEQRQEGEILLPAHLASFLHKQNMIVVVIKQDHQVVQWVTDNDDDDGQTSSWRSRSSSTAVARELLSIQFWEFQARRFPSGKLLQLVIPIISSKDKVSPQSWASVTLPCKWFPSSRLLTSLLQ